MINLKIKKLFYLEGEKDIIFKKDKKHIHSNETAIGKYRF